ncbi:DUF883 family protein [Candidatus Bodocaedibacter vickermanii]|uniref:DUF883 domain-containing protein n=1 Tax=Candidatus Bodocaedibacter vickermanii TaxID=2741701 RepID=A0A7L9RTK6_9PROT|nr:hypothetical protein CPBP_00667 [Candidatus Paracaedibacteraceae bacterium 'Lake Konstanz']
MKKSTNSPNRPQKNIEAEYHTFGEEFANLNKDLQTILQHAKSAGADLSKDAGREVWSQIENIASRASDINKWISSSASDFLNHKYELTKEKAQQYASDLESTVKEHPIQSLAVSFGIGLLFSWALRR